MLEMRSTVSAFDKEVPLPIIGGSDGCKGATAAEEGIAASDAAIEADRQATVATSGAMGDSDSPDALFGDAASKDMPPLTDEPNESFGESSSQDQALSGSDDLSADQGFSDETTFGDDEFSDQSSDFAQDDTSFSSSDESGDMGDSLSDAAGDVDTGSMLDTAKSIASSLWDFFSGDD